MEVNVERLSMDELILYRMTKGKERLYPGSYTKYGFKLSYVKFIMEKSLGLIIGENTDGYYKIRKKEFFTGNNRLPCMVQTKHIHKCAHHRQCYLSYKCQAAPDVLQDFTPKQPGQVNITQLHPNRI